MKRFEKFVNENLQYEKGYDDGFEDGHAEGSEDKSNNVKPKKKITMKLIF